MLQFYFLSVLLNLLAGLVFIYALNGESKKNMVLSDSSNPFGDENFSADVPEKSPEEEPVSFDDDLSASPSEKKSAITALAAPFLADKTFQLVVGILSALTGLMKLLSPIQYDIAVIGDLIPSLAGLAAGAVLLLDWYQERSDVELALPEAIQNIYTGGRRYLGLFCIIAAVLHFIFPRVLFL